MSVTISEAVKYIIRRLTCSRASMWFRMAYLIILI